MSSIVAVRGEGRDGPPLAALKLARPDDPLSVEALDREIRVFQALCRAPGEPPCPRLYDLVDGPPRGLVLEWCPTDLERWWAENQAAPEGFSALCEALAAVCRRVREYAVVSEMELGERAVHADIKPRNILRSADGRWLLTDFGAAKSRAIDEESWNATRMIIGTENYIAPETLFNARKPHPAAMDTWSIGCTFFACLRMRSLLRGGGRLPPNGTHAHHFRTHRAAVVADLQLRRPTLFADRELDPAAFPSAERLPDKDRAAIEDALLGVLEAPALEERLVADTTNLLDRALQIDPARRYTDPIEMAGDFEVLAQRYRELRARSEGGPTGPRASVPVVAAPLPTPVARPSRWRWALGGSAVAIGILVVVAGVALAGGVWVYQRRPEPAPAAEPSVAPAPAHVTRAPAAAPATAPPPATPAPEAPRTPKKVGARPPAGEGTILVFGASEAWLKGKGGRRAPGTLPAGAWELVVTMDGVATSQGTIDLAAGERIVWRCGFGKCREAEVTGPDDEDEEEPDEAP